MQVYKFGGASIATPERMINLLPIIQKVDQPLMIIVSAIGKTTNALESIAQNIIAGEKSVAEEILLDLEKQHVAYVEELLGTAQSTHIINKLQNFFTEIIWAMDDAGIQDDQYVYDQIVCVGELLSTIIFSEFLQYKNIENEWIDARDIVKTDERYRQATVDEATTQKNVSQTIIPKIHKGKMLVTQGFIGSSSNNNSTTLGREGSDYSAALLASMVDANSVTIWKDVPGFLNADPRIFPDAITIPEITYQEVIELTYYGAQIIHPKTIKPLHNKKIPLYVKCFLDDTLPGTHIHAVNKQINYPPLIVVKPGQSLIKITTLDFSFITEDNLSRIYQIFHSHNIKINMLQNTAISFVACIDAKHFALKDLKKTLESEYQVAIHDDMTMLTIRHYNDTVVKDLTKDKRLQLVQHTKNTYQALYREDAI